MISDSRTHNRVSFFMGGDLYRDPNGHKAGRAVIHDISFSGLRLETLEPLQAGENVFVDFTVCGRFRFNKVPVSVARTQRQGGSYLSGLRFQRGEDRRKIRQALAFAIESST